MKLILQNNFQQGCTCTSIKRHPKLLIVSLNLTLPKDPGCFLIQIPPNPSVTEGGWRAAPSGAQGKRMVCYLAYWTIGIRGRDNSTPCVVLSFWVTGSLFCGQKISGACLYGGSAGTLPGTQTALEQKLHSWGQAGKKAPSKEGPVPWHPAPAPCSIFSSD